MASQVEQGVDTQCSTSTKNPSVKDHDDHELGGVWELQWEEANGICDRETLVWWIQSSDSSIYVDIRIPPRLLRFYEQQAEQRTGTTAEEPPANLLLLQGVSESFYQNYIQPDSTVENSLLLELQSFAGRLALTTTSSSSLTCHWHRAIDIQPPAASPDMGHCTFVTAPAHASTPVEGGTFLHEAGVDGSYTKLWWRRPGENTDTTATHAQSYALELDAGSSSSNNNEQGYWVVVNNNRFGYAVGQPWHTTAGKRGDTWPQLCEAIDMTFPKEQMDLILSFYLTVMGEILDDGTWRILYSTHPEWVGCAFPKGTWREDGCVEQCLVGSNDYTTKRVWKVVSTTGDRAQVPSFWS